MRLSEKERRILYAAQLNSRASVIELGKQTGYRTHAVRYCLQRFRELGLLRYVPFVNVYPLGFTQYGIFFSMASVNPETAQQVLKYLEQSEQVSFIVEVGGNFQYGISVCTDSIFRFHEFLNQLGERFGEIFSSKAIAVRVRLTDFSMKYLWPSNRDVRRLSWGETKERIAFDETDHKILRGLTERDYSSMRGLGEAIGVQASLVEQRFRRLEKKGVIVGHHYVIDTAKIGLQSFYFLIDAKGIRKGLSDKFLEFSHSHPNVVFFLESLGSWDYEMGVECENPDDVVRLKQELLERFGNALNSIDVLYVFRYHKVAKYPFKSYPSMYLASHESNGNSMRLVSND